MALIVSIFFGTVHGGIAGGARQDWNIYNNSIYKQYLMYFYFRSLLSFLGFGVAGFRGFVAGMIIVFIVELHFFDLHFCTIWLGAYQESINFLILVVFKCQWSAGFCIR